MQEKQGKAIEKSQQKGMELKLVVGGGLAAFQEGLVFNFRLISRTIAQQQGQIDALREAISQLSANKNQQRHETESLEGEKETKAVVGTSSNVDDKAKISQKEAAEKSAAVQNQQRGKETSKQARLSQQTNKILPHVAEMSNEDSKKQVVVSSGKQSEEKGGTNLISDTVIESKVFELFERVRQLEQRETATSRQTLKNFREIEFTLQANTQALDKNTKSQQQFEQNVDKLRNELSEFKLKKEAKLMKVLHSNSVNQTGSNSQGFDYLADKIQYLLKYVKQLVPKRSYEDERDLMQQTIDNLRNGLNQAVNEEYLAETMKNQEHRIYQSVAKYVKSLHISTASHEKVENETVLDSIIAAGNRQFTQKVAQHSQHIKSLEQEIVLLKSAIDLNRKERLDFEDAVNDELRARQQFDLQLQTKIEVLQSSQNEQKQSSSQKHLQTENQIIELQQTVDKIVHQLKSLNFANRTADFTKSPAVQSNGSLDDPASGNNPQIQGDVQQQKKKMNKMIGKFQSLKEDVLALRQDLMRELDYVKAGLEKKADWESLKKALGYFDDKMKDTKNIIQALAQGTDKNQNGESLAAKKGWTCLVCDKDIKNYEGRLSEIKFTSVFPVRESPRIGGYFKQQQATQQYKQVFLSNSYNNRNRRIGSLKPNQSREELP